MGAASGYAGDITSIANGNWHQTNAWGYGITPGVNDNVTIAVGHTVTVAQAGTSYTVSNLTVNGTLTHSANTTVAATPYYTIDLTINGALSVAGTGMIDAKAKGFSAGNGPAAAGGSSGASHGGLGTGGSLPTYGSVTNPTTLGSGGSHAECVGGGAVILRVSGGATVDGVIRADGGDKAGDWRRGASGGSVNLSADTLSGTGTVSASGSPLSYNYPAGGGGRVAVKLVSGTGTGSVALKAYGENNGGAPGTIYVQTTGQSSGQGTLIVDAGGRSVGDTTLISTNVTGTVAGNVIVGTNCVLAVASNTTLALSGNVSGNTTNAYLKLVGGTLTVPAAFSVSNCTFWVVNPSTFSPASVTVASNGLWISDFPASLSGSLTVQGGGRVTHSANSTVAATPYYKVDLTIGGSLTVETNGMIDAKAKGFSSQNGPGKSSGGGTYGASHGGLGGNAGAFPTYGSVTNPTTLGSGGSYQSGGGAIILRVAGGCTLHGIIMADGGNFDSSFREGAAGGSVNLNADTLTGTGLLSANGNTNSMASQYNGGGGGRIAVRLATGTDFGSVVMQAFGGPGSTYGAAGTLYRQIGTQAAGQGNLIVDNRGSSSTASTLISTNVTDALAGNVTLGTNAILAVASNTTLALSGNVSGYTTNAYLKLVGGTVTVPAAFTFSNCTFWIANPSTCSPATSLTVPTNSILLSDATHTIAGSLIVQDGGLVTHSANSTVAATPYNKVDLTIGGSLTVAAGGRIDVKQKGFSAGNGPAPGSGCNASHGGLGTGAGVTYTTYGSITNPTTLGSGGQSSDTGGGGAVSLRVSGAATVNGLIRADAGDSTSDWRYSAAGGSVNLVADTLTGSGVISANGNTNAFNYSGGGGGRVAVKLASGPDTGGVALRAYGGKNGGAPGTVYLQTTGQGSGQGTLIVDGGGLSVSASTLISTNVTDSRVGTLIITNSGVFNIASNVTFTLTSNFLNYAQTASLCATGGTFEVGGSGTMTIAGTVITNRFYNFTCTNAGKRIVFPSGSSNVLTGVLNLQGAEGNLLQLAGSGAGQWRLVVPAPSAMHTVKYVDVTNCNSWGGAEIQALDSIGKYNNNSNWSFSSSTAATNTWLGGSTSWIEGGNWSEGNAPTALQVVRITKANNPANWPILNTESTFMTLLLEADAQMSLGGNSMTVNTNLVVAGTLIASGIETVTLKGDANWAGGTFTKASSTVVIGGTGAQALDFSGIAFNNLASRNANAPLTLGGAFSAVTFTNTGSALTFANAISVGSLVNNSANLTFGAGFAVSNFYCVKAGITNTFKDGATYSITNLTLAGSAGNRLVLASSVPGGTKWKLNVSGLCSVSGVMVSDSDANDGQTIRPVASVEGTPGSTLNWDFGGGNAWKAWIGVTADFAAGGNWSPAGTPGVGDRLLIERTNGIAAPVLTNTLTVADLAIGGLAPALLTTKAPLTVTNRVAILEGGVLTHALNDDTNNPLYRLDLTVGGNLEIAPGGAIDVRGRGYAPNQGPAPGQPGDYTYGACHGGVGGYTTPGPYTTYGSVTNPTLPGSGGGRLTVYANGAGGGVVLLRVTGNAQVDGLIRADAALTGGGFNPCGAGGSVNVLAGSMSGSGTISANGNMDESGSALMGGGGGRIAVKLTGGTSAGGVTLKAYGGGSTRGASGSIYLQTGSQADGRGTLILDAGGYTPSLDARTLISTNVTDVMAGDVLIRNSASFALATNTAISVAGSWSNAATFTAVSNSVVSLTGVSTATVYGANTFGILAITNDSRKTVYFQGARTNWVNGGLYIRNAGLYSTSDGTQWHIRLVTNAPQDVVSVLVKDSNATNGQTIVALRGSQDVGNNVNWYFKNDPGSVFRMR